MSARNGDKARFGAQRKRKAAQRMKIRALREELKTPAPQASNQEDHHGTLNSAAEAIGSALGNLAAKAKHLIHSEPTPAQE